MVYGFVRQSGGHVAISSAPGRGTEVTIHLPRAPDEAGAEAVLGVRLEVQVLRS